MDALERFRTEFKGWIRALNRTKKDLNALPDEVLQRLENRLPKSLLRQIGAAFINGWLQNEPEPNRRYFVKESDRLGSRGGQWTVGHAGGGRVDPCWELHVQLADYSRIRDVAERYGLTTRLEDHQMDITVYAGKNLLLYVENKEKKEDALRLLERMIDYGKNGFKLDDPDINNDPLRKAKYLVREGSSSHPHYFALSAIDFEQVFRVEYFNQENRFLLHKTNLSLTRPLHDTTVEGIPCPRSIVDFLRLEFERLLGDRIWISPGSGMTDCNFYAPSIAGDAIFLGVYEDGRVWSDLSKLGMETANRLTSRLSSIGITLDTPKWSYWKKNGQSLNLHNEDPIEIIEIASSVATCLFPETTDG